MIRTFKYKLYTPRESVLKRLDHTLSLCCELYNDIKASEDDYYRKCKKRHSFFDLTKLIAEVREINPEFKAQNTRVLDNVAERFDANMKGFFARLKSGLKARPPRFKSRSRYDSITFRDSGYKLKGNKLIIKTIGTFKIRLHRDIPGKIKRVTIIKKFNGIFVCFTVETEKREFLPTNRQIGIDLNVKDNYCALSNGESFKYTKPHKQSLPELKLKSRDFSKKSTKKKLYTLQKVHNKITNQRKDYQHKLSRYLINEYDTIAVEDLKPQQMLTDNNHINRSFLDQGFSQFLDMLSYKAEEAGKTILKVNPAYTSKTCSCCGYVKDTLKLTERMFNCPSCHLQEDRDVNAAKNVLKLGLSQLEGAGCSLVANTT